MRQPVVELSKMGPPPSSDVAVRENLRELADRYQTLLESVQKPVSDEEARALVALLGPDDFFGLVWPLVGLIESAPGWPLDDCLKDIDNEWIRMLRQRLKNSKSRGA